MTPHEAAAPGARGWKEASLAKSLKVHLRGQPPSKEATGFQPFGPKGNLTILILTSLYKTRFQRKFENIQLREAKATC